MLTGGSQVTVIITRIAVVRGLMKLANSEAHPNLDEGTAAVLNHSNLCDSVLRTGQ